MCNCECAMSCMDDERLTIDFFTGRTGAVPRVTDAEVATKFLHVFVVENIVYHAHAFVDMERFGTDSFARDDTSALLPSVLQSNETCKEIDDFVKKKLTKPRVREGTLGR